MGLEALGISPSHRLAGQFHGRVIICGSARCVWDDIAKVDWQSTDIMTVNDLVMHFPGRVVHAYSNDNIWLPKWVSARRPVYIDRWGQPLLHSCNKIDGVTWEWPGHGTSSLNAVYTALALGYKEIVLAGIPLDNTGHYFDPPWVESNFRNEVAETDRGPRYWETAARNVFDGRVKSLSGRTRDLLGEP